MSAANLVEIRTPMPDDSANSRASAALERVRNMVVNSSSTYVAAAADLAEIKGQFKTVDKQREELKAPSLEGCRRVDAFFRAPLEFLKQAETIVKGKLTAYDKEQERIRAEEQRRLDEIARKERERKEAEAREVERKAREQAEIARREAEAQRQAEERARREAEEAERNRQRAEREAAEARARGDREAAEAAERQARAERERADAANSTAQVAARDAQRFDSKADRVETAAVEKSATLQAEAASVVAPVIQRAPPRVAGLSFREVPAFEITDKSKLPAEYLMPDETRIRKVVNALKLDANIPGVRVWMEKQPASSSAR